MVHRCGDGFFGYVSMFCNFDLIKKIGLLKGAGWGKSRNFQNMYAKKSAGKPTLFFKSIVCNILI